MLLICYGTRPEFIKVKSLISNLSNIRTLFTGQHTNLISTSDNDMILPDISLNISHKISNRLNNIISSILDYDDIFHGVSAVLVQGDTTSALAIAISAFNHKVPVIHLEAGLRTYDPEHPFPEEINRQLIARIASIHLCPTSLNYKNLIAEQINPSKIFIVGNTGLDNINHILSTNTTSLVDILRDNFEDNLRDNWVNNLGDNLGDNLGVNLEDNGLKYVLVTLHRRENIPLIDQWFMELVKIARKYNNLLFIFPIHPNPLIQQYRSILTGVGNIILIDPLSHENLILVINSCRFIITDSGGIQEEASFLKKKLIVCRQTTERSELVGNYVTLASTPSCLLNLVDLIYHDYHINDPCPYGDGNSWIKVRDILAKYI